MRARSARTVALIAGGAFAVHQVRYLVAYGHDSTHRLAAQGHAYLPPLLMLAAVVLALGATAFAARAARALPAGPRMPRPGLARTWRMASGWLVGLYCLQESVEGLFEAGHPAGFAGVFGGGGWLAIPAALALGFLIALALAGADAALESRPAHAARAIAVPAPRLRSLAPAPWTQPRTNLLARHLAGRGPPVAFG
jgi:hypothetical protein